MTAGGHYHCSVNGVGRASGRSVVAAAAYRAGERLRDETAGIEADYSRRHGVLDSFILAPENAPAWAHDRERLWNEAERAEPRANGRLATELQVALPHELDARARRELVESFARRIVERHGVAADVAIHAPGEGGDHRNFHAHILVTHRALGRDGFGEIANERTITKKVKGQDKPIGIAGIAATPADIRALRQEWEHAVNRAYERAGLGIRVDHRSHKDRGIEDKPTKHLGPTATEMERDGKASDRGDVNREIEKQNAEQRELKKLEAEARQLGVAIVELQYQRAAREAHDAARGRIDRIGPEFTSAASRATEPRAPNFDRDAANAAWMDQVNAAGVAKDEAARAAETPQQAQNSRAAERDAAAKTDRALSGAAAEIRAAWSLSRTASELEDALAARGLSLAVVAPEEAYASERRAALAKEAGGFAPVLREGEIVAVDGRGRAYRLNERTTGDGRGEIEGRLAGIDRAALMNVTATQEAMRAAAAAAEQSERQAEREQARTASWIESRIAACAERAALSGAVIQQDAEGRRITGADALADRLRADGERSSTAGTVYGAEAFAARLEDAGIAIVRVTAADRLALDALRRDAEMDRLAAATNRESYSGNRFAELEAGELAAVTRNGDVHRINPAKLGNATRLLPESLPSVVEARAAFEIDRERTDTLWAGRRAESAATGEAFAAEREQRTADANTARAGRRAVAAVEKTADKTGHVFGRALGGIGSAVEKMLGGLFDFFIAPPKLTRDQAERKARADDEKAEAHAWQAARQEKEAARDEQAAEQNRREQQRDLSFAERFGTPPTREANTGREHDDDYGRGRERERER